MGTSATSRGRKSSPLTLPLKKKREKGSEDVGIKGGEEDAGNMAVLASREAHHVNLGNTGHMPSLSFSQQQEQQLLQQQRQRFEQRQQQLLLEEQQQLN